MLSKIISILVGGGLIYMSLCKLVKRDKNSKSVHFSPEEFQGFYNDMSPKLLSKLDEFYEEWGQAVEISPAIGAVGRCDDSNSQHNMCKWGEVRAVDVFPYGMRTQRDIKRAIRIAFGIGFKGIGVYLDTKPGYMLHLDVRDTVKTATWSRINGEYLSIKAIEGYVL